MGFLGHYSFRLLSRSDQTIEQLQFGTIILVLAYVVEVAGAVVAIALVGRITSWQAQRVAIQRRVNEILPGRAVHELPATK